MKVFLSILLSFFLFIVALPVLGQSGGQGPSSGQGPSGGQGPTGPITIPNPLAAQSISDLLNKIIDFLIIIASPILVIMVLWAGFLYLTSGGDPTKVQTANRTLLWAAVGFAIILISKGFTLLIANILGGGSSGIQGTGGGPQGP